MGIGAEIDRPLDAALERRRPVFQRREPHLFRAHGQADVIAGAATPDRLGDDLGPARQHARGLGALHALDRRVEEVGLADEVGDEAVDGALVDVLGRADLLHPPVRQDRDAVGHGERLFLIVGHEDEGDPRLLLELLELDAHGLAKLEVEGRQGLVEEQHLGPRGQRPGQRHPLLLAARKLRRPARGQVLHMDEPQDVRHHPIDLGLRAPQHAQREADIGGDGHVGEQRVLLEDRVDGALVRRQVVDLVAEEADAAPGQVLEPRDAAQQRGLAAAGRPQEREELVIRDLEAHVIERRDGAGTGAEDLGDVLDLDGRGYRLLGNSDPLAPRRRRAARSSRIH